MQSGVLLAGVSLPALTASAREKAAGAQDTFKSGMTTAANTLTTHVDALVTVRGPPCHAMPCPWKVL
jgi:hypothetical protein